MSFENSKTFNPYRLVLNFTVKTIQKVINALYYQILVSTTHGKT